MSRVVHKITFQIIENANTPDFLNGEWLINPSSIPVCQKKYWKLVGEEINEMSQMEKDEVDYSTESTIYLIAERQLLTNKNGHDYETNINAIINPKMPECDIRYTKVIAGIIVEMTPEEKAIIDVPEVERTESLSNLRDSYITALSQLQTIQNLTTPTNAQVIAGVKKLAEIQEKILKYIYRNHIR